MSSFVLRDAEVVINGVDLSDHVTSLTVNYGAELQDQTAMGDLSRRRDAGLIDWSMDVEFKQDFDSGSVDATLFALVGAASAFTITAMANKTAGVSATNPRYSGTCHIEAYPPLDGTVGAANRTRCTFRSDSVLTRNVA